MTTSEILLSSNLTIFVVFGLPFSLATIGHESVILSLSKKQLIILFVQCDVWVIIVF